MCLLPFCGFSIFSINLGLINFDNVRCENLYPDFIQIFIKFKLFFCFVHNESGDRFAGIGVFCDIHCNLVNHRCCLQQDVLVLMGFHLYMFFFLSLKFMCVKDVVEKQKQEVLCAHMEVAM